MQHTCMIFVIWLILVLSQNSSVLTAYYLVHKLVLLRINFPLHVVCPCPYHGFVFEWNDVQSDLYFLAYLVLHAKDPEWS